MLNKVKFVFLILINSCILNKCDYLNKSFPCGTISVVLIKREAIYIEEGYRQICKSVKPNKIEGIHNTLRMHTFH